MIRVDKLVYEYPGKRALDGVSFTIETGTITALVGPNGAGKTTLLRCIAGIDDPFSGSITVAGIEVTTSPRRVHKELGYLSDFFGIYTRLTVKQCLLFAGMLHQLEDLQLDAHVQETAELLGLVPYLKSKAATLSRGWRQRVGIAQAIIHKPKLLLLDEPASGLDPESRMTLSSLFLKLRDQGMTLVVSSHVLAELEDYCTDMLVLREGKVVQHCAATASERHTMIEIAFLGAAEALGTLLRANGKVVRYLQEGRMMHVEFSGTEEEQHELLKTLITDGAYINSFTPQRQRLQDIYMSLSEKAVHGKSESGI